MARRCASVAKLSRTDLADFHRRFVVPNNMVICVFGNVKADEVKRKIEAKFGAEGVRQFLFALRKSVIGGGEDAYEEALRMKPDEFVTNDDFCPNCNVETKGMPVDRTNLYVDLFVRDLDDPQLQ